MVSNLLLLPPCLLLLLFFFFFHPSSSSWLLTLFVLNCNLRLFPSEQQFCFRQPALFDHTAGVSLEGPFAWPVRSERASDPPRQASKSAEIGSFIYSRASGKIYGSWRPKKNFSIFFYYDLWRSCGVMRGHLGSFKVISRPSKPFY